MPSIRVLEKINFFSLEEGYFIENGLLAISDEACENNNRQYIDFDATVKKVQKEKKEGAINSCDSLVMKQEISFIEFKRLKKVSKHDNDKNFFENLSNRLFKKLKDSIHTLNHIAFHKKLRLTNKEINNYKSKKINYYVFTDVSKNSILGIRCFLIMKSINYKPINKKFNCNIYGARLLDCDDIEESLSGNNS